MPTLRPFRDYNEKDVINLFSYSGAVIDTTYQIQATKGTLVKITGPGFVPSTEPIQMIGSYGNFQVNNFVAQRYGTVPAVTVAGPGDSPIGMLLFDVRELDENLIPLKYNPRKAAEMEVAISGTTVPIVTKGTFLYSGVVVSGAVPVTAGAPAYVTSSGLVTTSGANRIGKFLGATGAFTSGQDNSQMVVLYLNCQ